ncbi:MAG: hypothetical protein AAGF31_00470 [Planctomycetota bacterium]
MFDKHWTLDPHGWERTGKTIQQIHAVAPTGERFLPPTDEFKPTVPLPRKE